MTLNLGYTAILHGESVAYGLRGAFAIARALGITTIERAQRVNSLLDRLGLAVEPPVVSLDAVGQHMATDKKHALGRLSWVLPTETGVVIRSDVPPEAVAQGLAAALRIAEAGVR
jgi:3-dehydroquinate synthetase